MKITNFFWYLLISSVIYDTAWKIFLYWIFCILSPHLSRLLLSLMVQYALYGLNKISLFVLSVQNCLRCNLLLKRFLENSDEKTVLGRCVRRFYYLKFKFLKIVLKQENIICWETSFEGETSLQMSSLYENI